MFAYRNIITLLLFFLFTGFSVNNVFSQSKKELIRQSLNVLKKYDPQGTFIVQYIQKLPLKYNLCGVTITNYSAEKPENYLTENTLDAMINQLPTLVHEFNHEYTSNVYQLLIKNNICDGQNDYYAYLLDTTQTILVKLSKVFPSKQIYGYIQKNNLNTFRVSNYIGGNTSTQSRGIFGLLNEYNAYRLEAMCNLNLFNYYRDTQGDYKNWFIEYLKNTESVMTAYFEFKFFILYYLLYAKENQPKIYQDIITNSAFCKAFVLIENSFEKVVQQYIATYKKVISEMLLKGVSVIDEPNSEFVFVDGGGTVMLEKKKDYKILTNELKKPEYQAMMNILKGK